MGHPTLLLAEKTCRKTSKWHSTPDFTGCASRPRSAPARKGFVRWRAALGDVFEVRAAPDEIQSFRGEIEIHASARYVLSASRHSPLSLFRSPGAAILDRFAIRLSICGSVTELAGDVGRSVDPGDVVHSRSFPGGRSAPVGARRLYGRSDVMGRTAQTFARSSTTMTALYNVVLKGASPEGAMIGAVMRSLVAAAPKLRVASFNALADGVVVMVAKVASAEIDRVRDAVHFRRLIRAVRRFIDRNLRAPGLGPEMIRGRIRPLAAFALSAVRAGRRSCRLHSQSAAQPRLPGSRRWRRRKVRIDRRATRLPNRQRLQPAVP